MTTKAKIKKFQLALGSLDDGIAGASTWDSALRFLEYEGYTTLRMPYSDTQFGCKVAITRPHQVRLYDTEGAYGVNAFSYSMSGTFTIMQGDGKRKPISIMINEGHVLRGSACHAYTTMGNFPEGILYYTNGGKLGTTTARFASELKDLDIRWAIGGLTMLPKFNAEAEGFTGVFSDVFRYTSHNAIGFDKYGNIIGVYHRKCTLKTFQKKCRSIGLVEAISVDGGSISAINAGSLKANIYLRQGSIIGF